MTRLRKRAAERLLAAQHEKRASDHVQRGEHGPGHGICVPATRMTSSGATKSSSDSWGFFVKAAIEALKRFPIVNASIDGDDIIYHGYIDIGIAVSSERGLVVPILRDVDSLSFADTERQIADFAIRAQSGKMSLEELTGGNFTITNGGVFGSLLSTPILNPPTKRYPGHARNSTAAGSRGWRNSREANDVSSIVV